MGWEFSDSRDSGIFYFETANGEVKDILFIIPE